MSDGTAMTYDVANQVQSKTKSGVTTNYGYDNRGNRTSATVGAETTTLGYDQANRLKSYGTTAAYSYDGGGLRTSKSVGSTMNAFTYSTAEGLPLVIDDGSNAYVYGSGGMVLEQVNGSTPTYLHQDQLGSTRLLTDGTGATVGTYQFDAYGSATHTGTASTQMQYAGQYVDAESGLYWMRARYYDPTTGQFVSRDPIVSVTRDPYGYGGGEPTNMVDPSGLYPGQGLVRNFQLGAVVVHDTIYGGDFDSKKVFPEQSQAIADTAGGVLDGLTLGHASVLADESHYNSDTGWHTAGSVGGGLLLGGVAGKGLCVLGGAFKSTLVESSMVGKTSRLFGRKKFGVEGTFNSNNYLRIGWGWDNSTGVGMDVFRISLGGPKVKLPPHWHKNLF